MSETGYRVRCLSEKGRECAVCGERRDVIVHHLDADRSNNAIENLLPLCLSCHGKVHQSKTAEGKIEDIQSELPDPPEQRSRSLVKPSFSMSEEFLDRFEAAVFEAKVIGELPRDMRRSGAVRVAMQRFIDQYDPEDGGGVDG